MQTARIHPGRWRGLDSAALTFALLGLAAAPAGLRAGAAEEFWGRLPLSFEENRGQTAGAADFIARAPACSIFLTAEEAVLACRPLSAANSPSVLRLRILGGDPCAAPSGLRELAGRSHYLLGRDPKLWRRDVPHFEAVRYADVYRGIDLVYHGRHGRLEFDFVLAPGADEDSIRFEFDGASGIRLQGGDLLVDTPSGIVRQPRPVAWEEHGGARREVRADFRLLGAGAVGFEVEGRDPDVPLVIDPAMVYSTLLGGSLGDLVSDVAVDGQGAAYVTGWTLSPDFPATAGAYQTALPVPALSAAALVAKIDPSGSSLIFATYLSGTRGGSEGYGIAVDAHGQPVITGDVGPLSDLFTTPNAVVASTASTGSAFATQLDAAGSTILYSTFISSGDSEGRGVALDAAGKIYLTGRIDDRSLPVRNGFQTNHAGLMDVYVMKLDPLAPDSLLYSTYAGGRSDDTGDAIAVDARGMACVTGQTLSTLRTPTFPQIFPTRNAIQPEPGLAGTREAFVLKVDPTQAGDASLLFSTFLGGSGDENVGVHEGGIAVAPDGSIVAGGTTTSDDFPTTPGTFQPAIPGLEAAFVVKLDASGSALLAGTHFGGGGSTQLADLAVDGSGRVHITGNTNSSNLPLKDAVQDSPRGAADPYVAVLEPDLSGLVHSTYLGSDTNGSEAGTAIAADAGGATYAAGYTGSWGVRPFPITAEAFQTELAGGGDGFVTKFPAVLPNRAPVTEDDLVTTRAGLPIEIDVLANDFDPDGDPLAIIEAAAANGAVEIQPGGTLTYTPAEGFIGTDTLSYTVTDGLGLRDTGVAWVTVSLPACEAPSTYFAAPQSGLDTVALGPLTVAAALDGGGFPAKFEVTDCDADGFMEILIPETPSGFLKPAAIDLAPACAPTPPTVVEVFFHQASGSVTWTALDAASAPVVTASTLSASFLQVVILTHPSGIARVEMTGSAVCLDEICYICPNPGGCSVTIVDTEVTVEPAGVKVVVDFGGSVPFDTGGGAATSVTATAEPKSSGHALPPLPCPVLTADALNKPKRYQLQVQAPDGDACEDDSDGSAGGSGGGTAVWTLCVIVECTDGSESTDCADVEFPCPEPHVLPPSMVRGDCNSDRKVNIADAVFGLGYLFRGTDAPGCFSACDANVDGTLDLSDALRLVLFLFSGAPPPPAPFPDCGPAPAGGPGCTLGTCP